MSFQSLELIYTADVTAFIVHINKSYRWKCNGRESSMDETEHAMPIIMNASWAPYRGYVTDLRGYHHILHTYNARDDILWEILWRYPFQNWKLSILYYVQSLRATMDGRCFILHEPVWSGYNFPVVEVISHPHSSLRGLLTSWFGEGDHHGNEWYPETTGSGHWKMRQLRWTRCIHHRSGMKLCDVSASVGEP